MRNISASCVPKCLNADQKPHRWGRLKKFWNFLNTILTISCRDWWARKKACYITVIRRQSNIHWSGGIAAHSSTAAHSGTAAQWQSGSQRHTAAQRHSGSQRHSGPQRNKNFRVQKFSEKFLASVFGIKKLSTTSTTFQRTIKSTRIITRLCWCSWRNLWRKNVAGSSARWSCSWKKIAHFTEHLQPRRNWPTGNSSSLITQTFLRIWPIWTTSFPSLWVVECVLDWLQQTEQGGNRNVAHNINQCLKYKIRFPQTRLFNLI